MIYHPISINRYPGIAIPEKMNNPLDYEPHPLCIAVCKELQAYLAERKDWKEEIDKGKMFGILIVEKPCDNNGILSDSDSRENQEREIGYLAAYSGQIGGRSDWEDFVPAVFDYLQPDGYFKVHEAEITQLNHAIIHLSSDEKMKNAKRIISDLQQERLRTIAAYQEKMKEAKAKRDARRQEALLEAKAKGEVESSGLSTEEEQAMVKESQFMKAELRRLKKALSEKTPLEKEYDDFQENLLKMKQLRKTLSDALQQWLFMQFSMLNYRGEHKNLLEIFKDEALRGHGDMVSRRIASLKMTPPAGSGECCEPKLLQYAFEHGLKPLQMAMFWWGESPKEEIRHHLQFYPACNGKCKPILRWMLPEVNEMLTDANKKLTGMKDISNAKDSLQEKNESESLEVLFEDREIAVICKPAGMLSVPGKAAHVPSVYSIMRKKYPEATGPLIVHRLDMATSGLMVIAKTEFAYHRLQEQFANHQVQKKYIAIVCCKNLDAAKRISESYGFINLPLMPDYLDRPRQIVNHEHGKEAITEYEVLVEEPFERNEGHQESDRHHYLRLALYPKTGRTHQLRVHCAHREGLDAPILGDPLYGNEKASRLYLHAEKITFEHPLTGETMTIERKADF